MKILNKLFIFLSILIITGCSVVTAASGSREPNFNLITKGTDISVVNTELGEPTETKATNGITTNTYIYKLGDRPALGRAIMHGVLDIFTLFLWEYIAFPMEIANSGNAYEAEVLFNKENKVISIKNPK